MTVDYKHVYFCWKKMEEGSRPYLSDIGWSKASHDLGTMVVLARTTCVIFLTPSLGGNYDRQCE